MKNLQKMLDILALFVVGGFIVNRSINDKLNQTITFFVNNGLQIVKFMSAIIGLLLFSYFLPTKIRANYKIFIMLCFAASKNVQKFLNEVTKNG